MRLFLCALPTSLSIRIPLEPFSRTVSPACNSSAILAKSSSTFPKLFTAFLPIRASIAPAAINFAIFPEEFEAGIIDLWAVNLISAVLPVLESGDPSKINCVVGLFDMNDGRMKQRSILVDTSRMSVTGKAEVDFRTERVKVELVPSPKKPEFFNLATPIQVEGTFSDFGIGVKPEDLLGTVIRFVTSIVHVPLQRIFLGVRPAEDIERCLAAMKRPEK